MTSMLHPRYKYQADIRPPPEKARLALCSTRNEDAFLKALLALTRLCQHQGVVGRFRLIMVDPLQPTFGQ